MICKKRDVHGSYGYILGSPQPLVDAAGIERRGGPLDGKLIPPDMERFEWVLFQGVYVRCRRADGKERYEWNGLNRSGSGSATLQGSPRAIPWTRTGVRSPRFLPGRHRRRTRRDG